MKKIFFTTVLLFSTFLFTFSQNFKSINYVLNGNVGTKNIYDIELGNGRVIGQHTSEIKEKYIENDTVFLKIKNETTGMGTIRIEYILKFYNDTVYTELSKFLQVENFIKSGVLTIAPYWLSTPTELSENQELAGYFMDRSYGSYNITTEMKNRKVEGFETVKTAAGDFECAKISYLIEAKKNSEVFTTRFIEWYNKDVGLVKQESYTKKDRKENAFVLKKTIIK